MSDAWLNLPLALPTAAAEMARTACRRGPKPPTDLLYPRISVSPAVHRLAGKTSLRPANRSDAAVANSPQNPQLELKLALILTTSHSALCRKPGRRRPALREVITLGVREDHQAAIAQTSRNSANICSTSAARAQLIDLCDDRLRTADAEMSARQPRSKGQLHSLRRRAMQIYAGAAYLPRQ